jgi:hypothetical protein
MRLFKKLLAGLVAIGLVACGGGGGSAGTQPGVTAPTSTAAAVEVLTSAASVASAGDQVVITAFVKSAANVSLAAQEVKFTASSGVITVDSSLSNASGAVTARLSAGANKAQRDITVTVTSGSASGQIVIPVTGTRLSIAGSPALQAGGSATQFTVRAIDSVGNAIPGSVIKVASALGNAVSPAEITTDSSGSGVVVYTPNNAGTDKLTVTGLGTSASIDISVNATDFSVMSPGANTLVPVQQDQTVTVRYRVSGAGIEGRTVTFSTTRGQVSSAAVVTNASGEAAITVRSATAGPAVITAQIAGAGQVNLPLQFVAVAPATLVLQANPAAVAPNRSGSSNQATVEALVRDAAGNAVANRQVNFTTLQDVSNGTLSPGVATTDSNGRAQVQFIPGANTTPAGGVVIQAQVASTSIVATAAMTVNAQALFISIGFGNEMSNLDQTTYEKEFTVYVTDANGVAVGGQNIALSAIPTQYAKGYMVKSADGRWGQVVTAVCANEDVNRDGFLDIGDVDENRDGILWPGNVVAVGPGSVTTDANGRAAFRLRYGEQYALWVQLDVVARGLVGGTESRKSIPFVLPILASDAQGDASPAGASSPYGQTATCTNPL